MNKFLRDLALELYVKHNLKPEDIESDGTVFIYSKDKGVHRTVKYRPLKNITTEEVYQFELNH